MPQSLKMHNRLQAYLPKNISPCRYMGNR